MTHPNEYYAYFTITGDFDPASITAEMGMEPTESWAKGSRNERTLMDRNFSRWSLHSRLPRTAEIEAHIKDVVLQLKQVSTAVVELGKRFTTEVPVVGYFYEGYPGMHLDAATLSALGVLNLDLDFDFYYLYSDKREDS